MALVTGNSGRIVTGQSSVPLHPEQTSRTLQPEQTSAPIHAKSSTAVLSTAAVIAGTLEGTASSSESRRPSETKSDVRSDAYSLGADSTPHGLLSSPQYRVETVDGEFTGLSGSSSAPSRPRTPGGKSLGVTLRPSIEVEEYEESDVDECSVLEQAMSKANTISRCTGPSKWLSWTQSITGDEMDRCFYGERPEERQIYVLPICIPMYNEDAPELMITLKSVYKMQEVLPPNYELKVCIILDGFGKVSKSALDLFRIMYPTNEYTIGGTSKTWEDLCSIALAKEQKLTVVLQAPSPFALTKMDKHDLWGDDWDGLGGGLTGQLDISLIIKVDNRKKHNSHDLFFRGFANHFNPEFCFTTDCGTYFERHCLRLLLRKISAEYDVIAVTGRQRVMKKTMQPGCQNEGPLGWALRQCQAYDYEASTVIFNGCFSVLGCLPVVPGPCGLFRLAPLLVKTMQRQTESAFDFYMSYAKRAEEDADMIKGNTILAEDRVLTYAALYLTQGTWKIRWVNGALFYFQSEGLLKTLVAQRRRWLNGTVAAFIFTLKELGRPKLPHSHPWWKVELTRYLIRLMLVVHVLLCMSPSLLIYGLHSSMTYIIKDDDLSVTAEILLYGMEGLWFGAFVLFCVAQHIHGYDARLFALCALPNAFASLLLIFALGWSAINDPGWIQWLGFFYFFLPVILNIFIPDFTSLMKLLNPFVILTYYMFMPTMQGYFLSFAVARTFDLSWGNRAGIGSEALHLKRDSQTMMVFQFVCNGSFLLVVLMCHGADEVMEVVFVFLAIILVGPTALVAICSAVDAFGMRLFALFVTLEVFLFFIHEGLLGDHLHDVAKWKALDIGNTFNEEQRLYVHQAIVILVLWIIKIVFKIVEYVQGKCFRNPQQANTIVVQREQTTTVRGMRSFMPHLFSTSSIASPASSGTETPTLPLFPQSKASSRPKKETDVQVAMLSKFSAFEEEERKRRDQLSPQQATQEIPQALRKQLHTAESPDDAIRKLNRVRGGLRRILEELETLDDEPFAPPEARTPTSVVALASTGGYQEFGYGDTQYTDI